MANWSNPLLTSTYTNFVTEVKDRDVDLALQFDGVTPTNIPTGAIRWNSSVNRWQKWSGTAWGELTTTYALTGLSTTGNASIGGTLTVTGAVALNGGGTAVTVSAADNSTAIATTAFVKAQASASLASPAFTGTPTAPTAAVGTNTTQLATTAFVNAEIANDAPTKTGTGASGTWAISISGTAATATTASSVAAAADQAIVNQNNGNAAAWYGRILAKNSTSDRASFLATYGTIAGVFAHNNALTAWADLYVNTIDGTSTNGGNVRLPDTTFIQGNQAIHAGNFNTYTPTLTGTGASGTWAINVTGSAASATSASTSTTQAAADNSTNIATTAFVKSLAYAPLASPALTGTPTAPTATAGTNTTQLATTAFVMAADSLKANLASPALTGTPTAPTALAGTNTTQIATTAFVTTALAGLTNLVPNTRTVTAGAGLTGGGALSGDISIAHSDTSTQGNVAVGTGAVISSISLDTYGHVTGIGAVDLNGHFFNTVSNCGYQGICGAAFMTFDNCLYLTDQGGNVALTGTAGYHFDCYSPP